ncbi:hypothetical protein B5M09_010025 [Aphanomyces astaci]|nr:hypothetical protein B5M09_010025 [Aphanomyces astaci]
MELPQYIVDFQVKISTPLSKMEWREFALTGSMLDVYNLDKKKTHSFRASEVTIADMSSEGLYSLDVNGQRQLVLRVSSQSRLTKFQHVLRLAATTSQWTPPVADVLTSLLSVATDIVEAHARSPTKEVNVSTVSIDHVQAHLADMHAMYQLQATCSTMEQVYAHLLDIEADYCRNVHTNNFAHTVYKLHPVQYARHVTEQLSNESPPSARPSIKALLATCPHSRCGQPLTLHDMYNLHVLDEAIVCARCTNTMSIQAFQIAAFIAEAPQFHIRRDIRNNPQNLLVVTPGMPQSGRVQTFLAELVRRISAVMSTAVADALASLHAEVAAQVERHFGTAFGSFHVDLVLAMVRQLDFVNKLCPHMEYWTTPVVIQASMTRYHKYLHILALYRIQQRKKLAKKHKPKQPHTRKLITGLVATSDIDLIMQAHQCYDACNYHKMVTRHDNKDHLHNEEDDLSAVVGPGIYEDLDDVDKQYADTFLLWTSTFNEPYSSFAPSYAAWSSGKLFPHFAKTKWRRMCRVPSYDCRFVGVDEAFAVEALPFATVVPDEMAVAASKTPVPDAVAVYLAVIGTPGMDTRVRLAYSRHQFLLGNTKSAAMRYMTSRSGFEEAKFGTMGGSMGIFGCDAGMSMMTAPPMG